MSLQSTFGMPWKTLGWKYLKTLTQKKKGLKGSLTENFTPMKFKVQLAEKLRYRLDECGKFCTRTNCRYRMRVSYLDKYKTYEIFLFFHMVDMY
jgi:hypothetical protein